MADVESLLLKLEADASSMRRELQKANRSMERFERKGTAAVRGVGKGFQRAQQQIGRNVRRMAAGLAGAFTAREIGRALEYGAALQHTATRVGFAAEAVQDLRFAASDFNIEARTVDMALQRFSRRVAEVADTGRGELLPMLQQMGIELRNNDGTLKTSEEVFREYADAIADMDNPNSQLLAAFKAFDSEGALLVNVMRQGREGMERYAAQARALGLILENDVVRAAAEADRRFDLLGQRMRTSFVRGVLDSEDAITSLATALELALPAVLEFLDAVGRIGGNMVGGIIMPGMDQLRENVENWADNLDSLAERVESGGAHAQEIRRILERDFGDFGAAFADRFDLPAERSNFSGGLGLGEMNAAAFLDEENEAAQELIRTLRQLAQLERDRRSGLPPDETEEEDDGTGGDTLTRPTLDPRALDFYVRQIGLLETSTETLRREIAAARQSEQAHEDLQHVLAGEEAVRAALEEAASAQLTLSGAQQEAIRLEAEEVSRLNAELTRTIEARESLATKVDTGLVSELELAKAEAEELATALGDAVGRAIGSAGTKINSLGDLIETIFRDVERVLVQEFAIDPLTEWATNVFRRILRVENVSASETMGTAISTSGTVAATAMGTAIERAGMSAAAAMGNAIAAGGSGSAGSSGLLGLLQGASSLFGGGGGVASVAGAAVVGSAGGGVSKFAQAASSETFVFNISADNTDAGALDKLTSEVGSLKRALPNILAQRDREKRRRGAPSPIN